MERSTQPTSSGPVPGLVAALALGGLGCAPTVDVLGVYFPGWLVSATAGLAGGYGIVWSLGRRPGLRELSNSGLFFVSLVLILSLGIWLSCFRGF